MTDTENSLVKIIMKSHFAKYVKFFFFEIFKLRAAFGGGRGQKQPCRNAACLEIIEFLIFFSRILKY